MVKIGYPSEHAEQVAVVRWLRAQNLIFFAVPNGAKTGKREGAKLKKEGLMRGIPDLIILEPRIALEMKRREGGRLSKYQIEWRDRFKKLGWFHIVGHGAQDAIEKLKEILESS